MPPAHRPLRHRGFLAGAVLVSVFAAASLLAPVLAPQDPHAVASGGGATLEGPTVGHPLGTDALGRDVLSRVLWGGRVSRAVGVGVEAMVVVLGCAVGLLAGYFGGAVDAALMRVTDVVMAFPSLVLAIGLIAVFERPGLDKVFIVLVALGWTTIARVVRGEVLSLKARDFVQAARALGGGHRAIMLRHLLPNALAPLLVAATIGVGGSARAEPREIRDPARRPGLASTLPLHAAFDPLAGEVVMHRSARPFVVVAMAIAGLAAVSSIAGARGRSAAALDPERLASL